MVSKVVESLEAAVAGIEDGSVIMIGGFGAAGMPSELIDALIAQGARDLTVVNNNAGNGDTGLAALLKMRRVKRIICSFPRQSDSYVFDALYRAACDQGAESEPPSRLAELLDQANEAGQAAADGPDSES